MKTENLISYMPAVPRAVWMGLVVAVAGGCDGSLQLEEAGISGIATATQALSDTDASEPETEARFAVSLFGDARLHETALWASDSMRIANGVRIEASSGSAADVVSDGPGRVELETDVVADGDVISRGTIRLADRCKILGAVKSEVSVEQGNDLYIEEGIVAPTTLEDGPAYEWTVSFPAPESDLRLEPEQSATLSPGSYGTVAVQPRATLTLLPGTYYFDSFTAEATAVLNLESDGEPIFVYVKSSLTSRAYIAREHAADLLVGFAGEGTVQLDGPFFGTVVAPDATIRLAPLNGGSHAGSFFGKRIEVEAWTPVAFVPFGHWDRIFPPVLTLECVSRAARQNSAALFSYENPLDIPVHIDDEARNSAEADTLRTEPLTLFEPGVSPKAFWISFIGESLSWTLDGRTVSVDSHTRGCTLDDYRTESDEPYVPTRPDILSTATGGAAAPNPGMTNHYIGTNAIFTFTDQASNPAYVPPTTIQGAASATIDMYSFQVGDDGFGPLDLDLILDLDTGHHTKTLYDGDWTAGGVVIPDVSFTSAVTTTKDYFMVVAALIERDIADDDEVLTMMTAIDKETGFIIAEVLIDDDGNERSVKSNLSGSSSCAMLDGWGFCYNVSYVPTTAKLCAKWKTQFRDSGVGETYYNDKGVQLMPASFAEARIFITGGAVPFLPWTDFFPLDKDGCVPEVYTPSVSQLTGSGGFPVQVGIEVRGRNRGAWTYPAPGQAVWETVGPNDQVFMVAQVENIGSVLGGEIDIPLNVLNEYTKSAAIAGFVLKRQSEGADMGLTGDKMTIRPAANDGDAHADEGQVYLRNAAGAVPYGDASDKYVVGHEIGHNIELLGSGWLDLGSAYGFPGNLDYPPSTPDECRCFVQKDIYSPLHCIQSIEWPNEAQMEGFAHFYATKLWSEPSMDGGQMAYMKWTFAPSCPTDFEEPQCVDILSVDAATRAQMTGFPQVRDASWKLVKTPYPIPMKENADYVDWRKWRNSHCLDPVNGTPDMSSFGVEMDWMRFYFALNTEGGPGQWLMQDIFDLVRAVATDSDGPGPDVDHSGEMRWAYLEAEAGNFSVEKLNHFISMGQAHGVNMNTAQ